MLTQYNLLALLIVYGFIIPVLAGGKLSVSSKVKSPLKQAIDSASLGQDIDAHCQSLDIVFELTPFRVESKFKNYRCRYVCELRSGVNLSALNRVISVLTHFQHMEYFITSTLSNRAIDLVGREYKRGKTLEGMEDIAANLCHAFPANDVRLNKLRCKIVGPRVSIANGLANEGLRDEDTSSSSSKSSFDSSRKRHSIDIGSLAAWSKLNTGPYL